MKNSAVFLLIILMVIQTACSKTSPKKQVENPPLTIGQAVQCHQTTVLDSVGISNKLTGKWNWEFISCYATPEKANSTDFKGLTVEFKTNQTAEVKLNGVTMQNTNWQLVKTNDGYYRLITNPLVVQLPGKILVCDNRIICYDSYTDGCDNYFIKQN